MKHEKERKRKRRRREVKIKRVNLEEKNNKSIIENGRNMKHFTNNF